MKTALKPNGWPETAGKSVRGLGRIRGWGIRSVGGVLETLRATPAYSASVGPEKLPLAVVSDISNLSVKLCLVVFLSV